MSGGETRLPVTAIRSGIIKSPSLIPSFSAYSFARASASSWVFPKIASTKAFEVSSTSFVFASSSFLGMMSVFAGTAGSVKRKCTISAASVRKWSLSLMSGMRLISADFTSLLVIFMLLSTQTGSPSSPSETPEYSGPTFGFG